MSETQFTDLIRRYEAGEVTEKERASVEQWLDHRATRDPFAMLTPEEKERVKARMLSRIDDASYKFQVSSRKGQISRGRTLRWLAAAASVALLIISGYFVYQYSTTYSEPVKMVQTTNTAGIQKVLLNDGSIVWLKGQATLRWPTRFVGDTRPVTLIGEALFEVAPHPAQPFTVQCGDLLTRVLGTSFNIKPTASDIEVTVLTGKVMLETTYHPRHSGQPEAKQTADPESPSHKAPQEANPQTSTPQHNNTPTPQNDNTQSPNRQIDKLPNQQIILSVNETATYQKRQNTLTKTTPAPELIAAVKTKLTTGTTHNMYFTDTPMGKVVENMEKKFEVDIILSNRDLTHCLVTADFTGQTLVRTLDIINGVLGVEYEVDGKVVKIKGSGCAEVKN